MTPNYVNYNRSKYLIYNGGGLYQQVNDRLITHFWLCGFAKFHYFAPLGS